MSRTWSLALLVAGAAMLVGAAAGPRSEEGLSYAPGPQAGAGQSLDLYLPEPGGVSPPLVVFVHSRFWSSAPGGRALVDGFAKPLRRLGAAVALVRHRLAPDHRHPAGAEDVAAALRFLVEGAERYGYDPQRIFLAGHSSGAHLAALVALDPRYLEAVGLSREVIAGVVGISGVYDLAPEIPVSPEEEQWYEQVFGDSAARRAASPDRFVRGDSPRFLLLAAQQDIPGYLRQAEAFSAALRDAGQADAEFYPVMGRNHASIVELKYEQAGTPMYLFDFLGLKPLPPEVAELREAARFWRSPKLSTEPFWTSGAPVHSHDADQRFVETVGRVYRGLRHKRLTFQPARFDAIDLFALLDALGPETVGRGEWLVTTNAQQQKSFFQLDALRPQRPVVVIGIDGERNLFRNVDILRARREQSWRDDLPSPAYSAKPMGGFIYLLDPPADEADAPTLTSFSLDTSSFRQVESDPLESLRDLEPELVQVLGGVDGCVQCHAFRGIAAGAGHLRATDGQAQGGFALPLAEYPPEVWKRFVFDPAAAFELVGSPHPAVAGAIAQKLFDAVESERGGTSRRSP
jgi:acetyl esterase/lipase